MPPSHLRRYAGNGRIFFPLHPPPSPASPRLFAERARRRDASRSLRPGEEREIAGGRAGEGGEESCRFRASFQLRHLSASASPPSRRPGGGEGGRRKGEEDGVYRSAHCERDSLVIPSPLPLSSIDDLRRGYRATCPISLELTR